jgi:hypothetical protein
MKHGIDLMSAIALRRGHPVGEKLGFSKKESHLLFWLASFPKYVVSNFCEADRKQLLEIIGQRPSEACRVMAAVQRDRNRTKDAVIRNVLLDPEAEPENWTLPDAVVADLVLKRIKQKYTGKKLLNFIETVKKARQDIAKKFPLAKGKI